MTSFIDPALYKFVTEFSLQKRQNVSQAVLARYPGRVPVMVGRAELKNTPIISKCKYLVPHELTFGKFITEIRKNMSNIKPEMALFFFLSNNVLIPSTTLISQLYEKYKADDGFLYIVYSSENTFGS